MTKEIKAYIIDRYIFILYKLKKSFFIIAYFSTLFEEY